MDVDPARVEAFNATHNIERGFGSLDAALAWGEFDGVANVTPDSIHHPTTMAALRAGKHVFCEKPLATDLAETRALVEEMDVRLARLAPELVGDPKRFIDPRPQFRQFCCPGCGLLIENEIALESDPLLRDVESLSQ